jgi:hypothetical protein
LEGQIELQYLRRLSVQGGTILAGADSTFYEEIRDEEKVTLLSDLLERWWKKNSFVHSSFSKRRDTEATQG